MKNIKVAKESKVALYDNQFKLCCEMLSEQDVIFSESMVKEEVDENNDYWHNILYREPFPIYDGHEITGIRWSKCDSWLIP